MNNDWRTRESPVWTNEQLGKWRVQVRDTLQPEPFRDWLNQFPGDHIVGQAYNRDTCTIANYLRDILPHLDCSVGVNSVKCRLPQLLPSRFNFFNNINDYYHVDLYYLSKGRLADSDGRILHSMGWEMPTWTPDFMTLINSRYVKSTDAYRLWTQGKTEFHLIAPSWTVTTQQAIATLDEVLTA